MPGSRRGRPIASTPRKETLAYAQRAFSAAEDVVALVDDGTRKVILAVRHSIMGFLAHDNRHLGMMESLKRMLTGDGAARI